MTPEQMRDQIAQQILTALAPMIADQIKAAMDVILAQANQQAAQTAQATVANAVQSAAAQVTAATQAQLASIQRTQADYGITIQAVRSGNAAYDPDIYGGG